MRAGGDYEGDEGHTSGPTHATEDETESETKPKPKAKKNDFVFFCFFAFSFDFFLLFFVCVFYIKKYLFNEILTAIGES